MWRTTTLGTGGTTAQRMRSGHKWHTGVSTGGTTAHNDSGRRWHNGTTADMGTYGTPEQAGTKADLSGPLAHWVHGKQASGHTPNYPTTRLADWSGTEQHTGMAQMAHNTQLNWCTRANWNKTTHCTGMGTYAMYKSR